MHEVLSRWSCSNILVPRHRTRQYIPIFSRWSGLRPRRRRCTVAKIFGLSVNVRALDRTIFRKNFDVDVQMWVLVLREV